MSDEKIDLAVVHKAASLLPAHWHQRKNMLALVALARAAMKFSNSGHVADRLALDAALAPFTDSGSAEVRSDD